MKALLNDRKMYLLIAGNLLSHIGTGVSMIAIPWLLVQQEEGSRYLGYATMAMSLVGMLLLPVSGKMVDRFSRKEMLRWVEIVGFTGSLALALFAWQNGDAPLAALLMAFGLGNFIFLFHYPAKYAYVQEVFAEKQFKQLNGLLEIQGQMAFVIAGGIGSIWMESIQLTDLLLFDAFSFFAAFLVFSFLPYPAKEERRQKLKVSHNVRLAEVVQFTRQKPVVMLFLLAAMIPFIITMTNHFLTPIHISKSLGANSTVMAYMQVVWASGSVLAGFLLPFLIGRKGSASSVVVMVGVFGGALLILSWFKEVPFYLVGILFMGMGNAGTRIARNTALMELVEPRMMGRVSTVLSSGGKLLQFSFLMYLTISIDELGTFSAYLSLSFLIMMVFAFVWLFKGALKPVKQLPQVA